GEDPDTFGYTVFRRNVSDTLTEHADELVDAAVARQRWFIALAALSVLMATTVTWLVSRSITRPLRALTRQAKDMAERRLPEAVMEILQTPLGEDVVVPEVEPIAVTTRDEVADVSAALNTVQDTALDLAVEQAVLRRNIADSFVNLGRRNQNLLGRQLDFITELESKETDPDTLANLFRLDHLATRMRRNAESLLVLAGVEPPRKWAAPVRLTESCSHEHAAWRGTVSISARTLYQIIVDIADSLDRSGVEHLVLINGHGGNYVLSNVVQEYTAAHGPKLSLFPQSHDWTKARVDAGMERLE